MRLTNLFDDNFYFLLLLIKDDIAFVQMFFSEVTVFNFLESEKVIFINWSVGICFFGLIIVNLAHKWKNLLKNKFDISA